MYFRLSPLNQKDVVGFAMLTTVFIYSFLQAESIAKDCCGKSFGIIGLGRRHCFAALAILHS